MALKRAFFNMQQFSLHKSEPVAPFSYCEVKGMREDDYRKFKEMLKAKGLNNDELNQFITFSQNQGFDEFTLVKKGTISSENFDNVYEHIIEKFGTGNRWFSVVSNNCAHHMSYLLAKYAFRDVDHKTPKIVINVDAHDDAHGTPGTHYQCGNWALRGLYNKVFDQYFHFGVKGYTTTIPKRYTLEDANKEKKYIKMTMLDDVISPKPPDKFNNWDQAQYLKAFNISNKCAYYVTVDLDFMKDSYTIYKDGIYEKDVGRSMLKKLFKKFDQNLYGVDVTGLPINQSFMKNWNASPENKFIEYTESALEDIKIVYKKSKKNLDW